jgi:exopolyphosphatase/guanosine-5'-triphosphate,3'-diphosphate pyrophosphatase
MPGLLARPCWRAEPPSKRLNHQAPTRRAVIDIGTNSVKLLVADVAAREITPIYETSKQTRLGAGFYSAHQLQPSAIISTAEAIAEFSTKAAGLGASIVRVIATSAARDARNADELREAVRKESGLELEIISGEKEAEWVFRGVASNPVLGHSTVLVLDVGGGSTEFIVGDNGVAKFAQSYGIGTVRLLEQLPPDDPPGLAALVKCRAQLKDFLLSEVSPLLGPALRGGREPVRLVGTGGAATILARMEKKMDGFNRAEIESARIKLPDLQTHLRMQWQMSFAERQKILGVPPKRADVILTGMAIYESIMEEFGFCELEVSTRGLRYAAIMDS